MRKYPKSIRRELQSLNGLAHERYLNQALSELQQHFSRWESKETNAFDLNEAIHQFHNGKSRELYNYFNGSQSLNDHRVVSDSIHKSLTFISASFSVMLHYLFFQ